MKASYVIRLILLAATLGAAFWLGALAQNNPAIQNLITSGGYLGVLIFSIINGFNVVIPVVTPSFIPALVAAGLDFYVLIVVMAIGMTIADSIAYLLARAGHAHFSGMGMRIERWLETEEKKRHSLPLWILGFWAFIVPLPNELVVVPLGLLGYPPRHVIPVTIAGNLAFVALVAYGFNDLFSMLPL